jgi:hypothetical protein
MDTAADHTEIHDFPPELLCYMSSFLPPADLAHTAATCREWFLWFDPLTIVDTDDRKIIEAARLGNFEYVIKKFNSAYNRYPGADVVSEIMFLAAQARDIELFTKIASHRQEDEFWDRVAESLIADEDWPFIAEILNRPKILKVPLRVFFYKAILLGKHNFLESISQDLRENHLIKIAIFNGDFRPHNSECIIRANDRNGCQYLKIYTAILIARRYNDSNITTLLEITAEILAKISITAHNGNQNVTNFYETILQSPHTLQFFHIFGEHVPFGERVSGIIGIICRLQHVEVLEFLRDRNLISSHTGTETALAKWLSDTATFARDHQFLLDHQISFDRKYFINHCLNDYKRVRGEQRREREQKICAVIDSSPCATARRQYLQLTAGHSPELMARIWSRYSARGEYNIAAVLWDLIINSVLVEHCLLALELDIPQPADLRDSVIHACIMGPSPRRDRHQILRLLDSQ